MTRVQLDEPITRVHAKHLVLTQVSRIERDIFFTDESTVALSYDFEGVEWLRGHHGVDAEGVKAARTGQALEKDRCVPTGPQGATGALGPQAQALIDRLVDTGILSTVGVIGRR